MMKTPEEHNKYLAYSHLGYGAFHLLMMLLMAVVSFAILGILAAGDGRGEFPASMVAVILVVSFIIHMILTLPSLIAGYGLLKRRDWAKTAAIIAGVLSAMSFPIGTAVCVYTFWFLLGDTGKDFYSKPSAETRNRSDYFLSEPSYDDVVGGQRERKREYVPPKEMPNWRD